MKYDPLLIGLITSSPITILTLGLLLNAYKIEGIITITLCGFLAIIAFFGSINYILNQKIKKVRREINILKEKIK